MSKSLTDEFLINFEGFVLPDDLSERFYVIECFANNENTETYLLAVKSGGKRFVLKCYKKSVDLNFAHEAELLSGLEHKGLPVFEPEIENDDILFILREYIEGVTLDEYLFENQPNKEQIVNIVMDICDILSYLHSQPAPIIHRDIKPSNIIINPIDNKVTLIDFGISRKYSEDAIKDTTNYGTKDFSPPEQYGFGQTDCRADIYSLGVVLRYMLTGTVDEKVSDKGLERIIKKCTAFSPKDRFKNCDFVKRALMNYKNHIWQKIARSTISVFVLFFVLVIGFSVGRYTEFLKAPPTEPEGYVFIEPLIEKAVRLMLNIPDGQPVTQNDMDDVTELLIVGNEAVRTADEINNIARSSEGKYGSLSCLDDLREMKNLRLINFFGQSITDLSPLADCRMLTAIDILFCPVTDLSPLASLTQLHQLNISGTGVRDFSPLDAVAPLRLMWIGGNMEQYLDTMSRDDIEVMVDGTRVNKPPAND